MDRLALRIDRLLVEADPARPEVTQKIIAAALERLAARLQGSPFARWERTGAVALEKLRIDTLSADELFGPRGAERLADELYTELTRRLA